MKLKNEFTVAAPLEQTWQTLLDVERVASCLPGATIEPVGEDNTYRGVMKLKVGPVSMSYSGTVRLVDVDEDERVASFDARAKETRGTGTAAAVIRNRLEPAGEGTRVRVETELAVTGRPAQFGRGLMEDVASKMLDDFAGRLEQLVVSGPVRAPAAGAWPPELPAPAPASTRTPPREEEEAAGLDLGSMLVRGYSRQLAAGGGIVAALLALLLLRRRPRRGFELTVRYRL